MPNLHRFIATSPSPIARLGRTVYRAIRNLSMPAPRAIVRPLLFCVLSVRSAWYFVRRVFYAEPLFKAYCRSYGRNVHTDIYLHWVMGQGDIILGDNVLVDGCCNLLFAARFSERPTLTIGSHTDISASCTFAVAKAITIGSHCLIGGEVTLRDSSGHATEAEARQRGEAPPPDAVRPIIIEDNVWIGARSMIGPGVTIGEGSIVAAGSIVLTSVLPYTIVSGNPARKVGMVPREIAEEPVREVGQASGVS